MIWGKEKFFVAPRELVDPGEILVVLTDIGFWADNVNELVAWCNENDCETAGMTVVMGSEKTLTAFCLRWT